eukprot:2214047-Alexandrium_andersonii.AAC.1
MLKAGLPVGAGSPLSSPVAVYFGATAGGPSCIGCGGPEVSALHVASGAQSCNGRSPRLPRMWSLGTG